MSRTTPKQVLRNRSLASLVCAWVAIGAACGDGNAVNDVDLAELFEPGTHVVGYQQATTTYSRAGTGEPRALAMSLWYPASDDAPQGFAEYTTGGAISIPSTVALVSPAVAEGGPFPVVVYSHGAGGEAQHAYPYAEFLASHGFVVISPEHPGTTIADLGENYSAFERWILDRPADITASLDWLENPTLPEIAGRTDTSQVGLIGFSMGANGGYMLGGAELDREALRAACSPQDCPLLHVPEVDPAYAALADSRIVAHIAQAPGGHPSMDAVSLEGYRIPTMLQVGRLDASVSVEARSVPLWEAAGASEDVWVEMPRGAHLTFLPTCRDVPADLLAALLPTAADDGCGGAFVPIDVALDGLAGYAHAYLRIHLLDEPRWEPALDAPLRDGFEARPR
ncbi:MAG: hypothetical protein AAF436_09055 [Myxococcota bacterium]